MARRSLGGRHARVGALIAFALLLLLFAVYRVGSVFDVFARRYEIVTLVPSALGLREGAPVTLAGQRIGQVRRIEFIPVERKVGDSNLRVVLAINQDVQDQIRTDSRAFLRTQGLLGDKFVDIEPGTPGNRVLAAGDTIVAGRSLDIDEFLTTAADVLEQASGIVGDLQTITGGLIRGEGTMGRLLTDDRLYVQLAGSTDALRRTLDRINRADGTFGRLIRDPELYERLHSAVARVDSLGAMILHSDGTLARLIRSDTIYRAVLGTITAADTAVADLAGFIRRMTEGDGALQRMLTDPGLYDEFLKAVIDVQTLINDIRQNPTRYRPDVNIRIF